MCLTYVKHLAGSYLTVSLRSTTVRHMSSSFLTSADVAAILRRTERTVVRLAAAGELPYIFKGNRLRGAYLFDPHVVEMYARHRRDRRVQQNTRPAPRKHAERHGAALCRARHPKPNKSAR